MITVIQTRVYLTEAGHVRFDERLREHCRLYNAAIQEWRDAWRRSGKTITKYDQNKSLTDLRRDPCLVDFNDEARRLQVGTLERADRARQAFYRRVKAGEKPGYPRFKPSHRFRTLEISGAAYERYLRHDSARGKGFLKIKGLPPLRYKCTRIPAGQQPLDIKITRKPNGVYLSMSFDVGEAPEAAATPPSNPVGIDMGVAKRAALSTGETFEGRKRDNSKARRLQRKMQRQRDAAVKDERAEYVFQGVSKQTGRRLYRFKWKDGPSRGYRETRTQLECARHRETIRDRNELHRLASSIVRNYDAIFVEDLGVKKMMKSAKGTEELPGRNVAQKRGLNRSMSEQRWAIFFSMLEYKAERAGIRFVKVNPKYTSQTCSRCGTVDGSSRKGAQFTCVHCGFRDDADHNASVNVLSRGMSDMGFPQTGESVIVGAGSTSPNEVRLIVPESRVQTEVQLPLLNLPP